MNDDMPTYDPSQAPDAEWWLALDEGERNQLVEDYHRCARVEVPNLRMHSIFHAIVETQALAVFANVRAVLAAAGADWSDIVDVTCFLTHMTDDFPTLNRLWAEAFPDPGTRPCRTTVEVSRLPTPIDIELKVVAWVPAG